ncbi:protein bem46, putative [Entamoeba invadens IP1]|uniref:Protein bem46, putative n=1 Tax=Entamoeba invadens IP1 TaxID=370355 RepID=A0A0A1TVX0_ENTIV|nr:protein bem46, putative [Entamoeba invadens IP1]ELP83428.1 protein bem46, putative [Entamoeba invadens IP1]|eukprot:XP_004182774.1 protein bem46, putative [Entamoeba invadens IP1]
MWFECIAFVCIGYIIYHVIHLYFNQHKLIFYPTHNGEDFPTLDYIKEHSHLPFDLKEVKITTDDNNTVYLYACLQQNPEIHTTILLFQSNAGSVLDRLRLAANYYKLCDVNFCIAVYRGFDKATGIPTEQYMTQDCERYFDALQSLNIDMNKVVVLGRSIGVSMALKLFNKRKCYGLIIENGFTSLYGMAIKFFPFLKSLSFVVKDKWDNLEEIQRVNAGSKILMFSSGSDEMVSPEMMGQLYLKAKENGRLVRFESFSEGNHMNLPEYPRYFVIVTKYLEDLEKSDECFDCGTFENCLNE